MDQKKKITFVYYLAFIALGLITGMLGPSLPTFAKNTGTTFSQLSTLFIFSSLGFMSGAFIAGTLLKKFDGHKVIAVVLVLLAIGIASLPLLQNLWVLILILFLLGICQAHLDVGENTLIMWLHGNQVAPYMNGLHFFFGLGSFIAPLLIAQSLRVNENLNFAFWIMSAVILIPVLFLLRFPPPTLETSPRSKTALSEKTPVALIVFLLLFFLGYVGAEMTLGNWLFTYATKVSTMGAEQAAYLTSVFWGVFTFSRLAAVFISKKLSTTVMLTGNLVGGAVTLILLILFVNQPNFLWVGSVLHALFIASTFPTAMNLAEQIGAVSSRVTSLIFIVASLGGMISPWIAGQWIESATPVIIIWIVLANFTISIVMFGSIIVFQQRRKQKKPPLTEASLTGNLNQ